MRFLAPSGGRRRRALPTTIGAASARLSGIPRDEPILDDLVEVGALNERVERIKDIIVTSWDPVGAQIEGIIEEVLGPDGVVPSDAQSPMFAALRKRLDETARSQSGFSYATYARLKISSVVDRYAASACDICRFPPDSSHAQLTRRVIRCWAENEALFEKSVTLTDRQLQFLIDFDLDYARRRLRFVIDGVSGWYAHVGEAGYPTRDQLDDVKGRLWDALVKLRRVMSGATFDEEVAPHLGTCFPESAMRDFMGQPKYEPQSYVQDHLADLGALEQALQKFLKAELATFTGDLYADLFQRTQSWAEERKRALLSRYLGFEWWDLLLYPVQALSDVGERDKVEVVRLSPRDATRIPSPQPAGQPKLVGAGQHHFGAFLSKRDGREKDYLWGRLDGAERLLGIVLRDATEADNELWFRKVASAILEEDKDALPNAGDLVGYVRSKVTG